MQSLNLNTTVKITNVNLRKELHGEDEELAVDINLKMEGSADTILGLFCVPEPLIAALWSGEDGYVAEPSVSSLNLGLQYDEHSFSVLDIELDGCKVCKFKLATADGRHVTLSFQVQAYPNKKQIGELSELIGENAEITIEPQQGDILDKAA